MSQNKTQIEQIEELRNKYDSLSIEELEKLQDELVVYTGRMQDPTGKLPVFRLEIDKNIKVGTDALDRLIEGNKIIQEFKYAGPVVQFFDISVPSGVLSWDDVKFVQYLISGVVIKSKQDARDIKAVLTAFFPANQIIFEHENKTSTCAEMLIRKLNERKSKETGLKLKGDSDVSAPQPGDPNPLNIVS